VISRRILRHAGSREGGESSDNGSLTDEWITRHFDHPSPAFSRDFHPTVALARSLSPMVRSDATKTASGF
jgi:hypothetical protein